MSWHPNDLVADADLAAYEAAIMTGFGQSSWQDRRTKALEDWLFPLLKGRGFDPYRLRTRYELDAAFGFTASVYSDVLGATRDTTVEDINLATLFATPASDILYLGSKAPFRGLFFRLHDAVSSVAGAMSIAYWNGNWEGLTITDGTVQVAGKTLSAGGSVTWTLPVDWATRKVNNSAALYWAKVTVSATPTGAVASQIGSIRASMLRAPATYRTLQLIFMEAPTGADGPWDEKAAFYKDEAEQAWQRAVGLIGGEFDTDDSDLISDDEAEHTAEQVGGGPFTIQRY